MTVFTYILLFQTYQKYLKNVAAILGFWEKVELSQVTFLDRDRSMLSEDGYDTLEGKRYQATNLVGMSIHSKSEKVCGFYFSISKNLRKKCVNRDNDKSAYINQKSKECII